MAAGIVITVAANLLAKLHSEELREICSMSGYESQLDDLKLRVSTIKSILLDVESKPEDLTQRDLDFIPKLKKAIYLFDDVVDEFNTNMVLKKNHIKSANISKEVGQFFALSVHFLVSFDMSVRTEQLRNNLDDLAKDCPQFEFSDMYVPTKEKLETLYVDVEDSIIGREADKEAIVEMLLGDSESSNDIGRNVSFVTIVGIGGIGKSELASLVLNEDDRIDKAFDLRLWVYISNDFDLEKIFRQMLKRDALEWYDIEHLQRAVRNLIEGKRYLIVLDNTWNESHDEWENLKSILDLGMKGSRVLVTSRSKIIANVVGDDLVYELKGLSEENSWNLFKRLAFEPMNSNDHLFDIGKEIVKKCDNVPLAIKVVASMLYDQDESKWLSFKNANLIEMRLGMTDVMSILKYSYYHLTPALRSCFSYCAFFPKDYFIEKELLIRLWMAHGLISL
ncbi:putative disease resistance protein RGA3 [Silene latifolia]|uniref:putative disease resistance protein RGA3 n=1 Tax=Silene latifolia TaxID=37657 RepID=UPI003D787914